MVFSTQRAALMLALSLASAGSRLAPRPAWTGDAPSLRPASDAVGSVRRPARRQGRRIPIAADALKIDAKTPEAAPEPGVCPPRRRPMPRPIPKPASPFRCPTQPCLRPRPSRRCRTRPARRKSAPDVDLPALRQAIDAYRKGRVSEGDRLRDGFTDPAARALLEWVAIRAGAGIGFERTVAFTRSNPDWPAGPLLRRRAEEALLTERRNSATVRAFFAASRPASAPGKFALALAFKADGLDEDAAALVRDLWRSETFGRNLETKVLDAFPTVLTRIDHRFRMERALLKEDYDTAGRAASLAGGQLRDAGPRPSGRRGQEFVRTGRPQRGAAVAAQRLLLHPVPSAVPAPARQVRGGGRGARHRTRQSRCAGGRRRVVGRAPDRRPQAHRCQRPGRCLRGGRAHPAPAPSRSGSRPSSTRAGSPCASRTMPPRRRSTSRRPAGSPRHRSRWPGRPIGRDVPPRPWARPTRPQRPSTSAPRSSRSPIMDSWPGRSSDDPACPCAAFPASTPPSRPPSTSGSTSAP